jgi:hypothetical protein
LEASGQYCPGPFPIYETGAALSRHQRH